MNYTHQISDKYLNKVEQVLKEIKSEVLNTELSEDEAMQLSGGKTLESSEYLKHLALNNAFSCLAENSAIVRLKELLDKTALEIESNYRIAENKQRELERERGRKLELEREREAEKQRKLERELEEAREYQREIEEIKRKEKLLKELKEQKLL